MQQEIDGSSSPRPLMVSGLTPVTFCHSPVQHSTPVPQAFINPFWSNFLSASTPPAGQAIPRGDNNIDDDGDDDDNRRRPLLDSIPLGMSLMSTTALYFEDSQSNRPLEAHFAESGPLVTMMMTGSETEAIVRHDSVLDAVGSNSPPPYSFLEPQRDKDPTAGEPELSVRSGDEFTVDEGCTLNDSGVAARGPQRLEFEEVEEGEQDDDEAEEENEDSDTDESEAEELDSGKGNHFDTPVPNQNEVDATSAATSEGRCASREGARATEKSLVAPSRGRRARLERPRAKPDRNRIVCPHSVGGMRFRPYAALTCTSCAYSICSSCFAGSALCAAASSSSGDESKLRSFYEGEALPCPMCKQPKALFVYDSIPIFPWFCEGLEPAWRMATKDGGTYNQASVHKYHMMRSLREDRRNVDPSNVSARFVRSCFPGPLASGNVSECGNRSGLGNVAACVQRWCNHITTAGKRPRSDEDDEGEAKEAVDRTELLRSAVLSHCAVGTNDSHREASAQHSGNDMDLKNAVIEGGTFYFTVDNPGLTLPCAWCAVVPCGRMELPGSITIAAQQVTITPLALWDLMPTLPGVTPPSIEFHVPDGIASIEGCSELQLWRWRDLLVHQSPHTEATQAPCYTRHCGVTRDEGLGDVKANNDKAKLPTTRKPFTQSRVVKGKVPQSAGDCSSVGSTTAKPLLSVQILHRLLTQNPGGVVAADGERAAMASPELSYVTDRILQGRNVAVCGPGSKVPFLDLVSRSSEFACANVHSADVLGFLFKIKDFGESARNQTSKKYEPSSDGNSGGGKSHAAGPVTSSNKQMAEDFATFLQRIEASVKVTQQRNAHELRQRNHDAWFPSRVPRGRQSRNGAAAQRGESSRHRKDVGIVDLTRDSIAGSADVQRSQSTALNMVPLTPFRPTEGFGSYSMATEHFFSPPPRPSALMGPGSGDEPNGANASTRRGDARFCVRRTTYLSTDSNPLPEDDPRGPIQLSPAVAKQLMDLFHHRQRCPAAAPAAPLQPPPMLATLNAGDDSLGNTTQPRFDLLILHNVDYLWSSSGAVGFQNKRRCGYKQLSSLLLRLSNALASSACHPLRVVVSFSDPEWLRNAPREFLDVMNFAIVTLRSPWCALQPCLHEVSYFSSVHPHADDASLLSGSGATSTLTGSLLGAKPGAGRGPARRGLPIADTVRRTLLSIPDGFRQIIRLMLAKQQEVGDGVGVPLAVMTSYFEVTGGLFVSQGRMRAVLQELTSNRLAVFDAAKNCVMMLQPTVVQTILNDVAVEVEAKKKQSSKAAE